MWRKGEYLSNQKIRISDFIYLMSKEAEKMQNFMQKAAPLHCRFVGVTHKYYLTYKLLRNVRHLSADYTRSCSAHNEIYCTKLGTSNESSLLIEASNNNAKLERTQSTY